MSYNEIIEHDVFYMTLEEVIEYMQNNELFDFDYIDALAVTV